MRRSNGYLYVKSYIEGSTISLESIVIGDKENGIAMISKYLDFLGVKDSIITIEPIGYNSTITNDIFKRNCSFFLS